MRGTFQHEQLGIQVLTPGPGAVVFRQGQYSGNRMYYVFDGELAITRERPAAPAEMRRIRAGDFMGEMALIEGLPRTGTARVDSPCAKIGIIEGDMFRRLVNTSPRFIHHMLKHAVRGLALADTTVETLIRRLKDHGLAEGGMAQEFFDQHEFDAGEQGGLNILDYVNKVSAHVYRRGAELFSQHDRSDGHMYFIFDGEVALTREIDQDRELLRILVPGDYFGEMALLNHDNRAATAVVTSEKARIGALDLKIFLQLSRKNCAFLFHLLRTVLSRLRDRETRIDELTARLSEFGVNSESVL